MAESRALSQAEVDALLSQIPESGEGEEEAGGGADRPALRQGERGFVRVVKTYDFRRPDKFSKEQWHTLQSMYEAFARLIGAQFSSHLRTLVTVRLASLDQGLYEEWQSQVPSQTACYVLSMRPLSGSLVVEFNNDVAGQVIDRLLGGGGLLVSDGRELSEIELALLRSFARSIGASLQEMWASVTPLEPELQDLSLDASLVQIAGPNDVVVTAFFEVNLGNHLGAMSICVPYTVLEPVAGKLVTQVWQRAGLRGKQSARSRRAIEALLGRAPVDVTVELGSTELTASSLVRMREGDTLVLSTPVGRPLPLVVGGHHRFLCRPGLVGNKVGVQVTDVVAEVQFDFAGLDDDETEIGAPDTPRTADGADGADGAGGAGGADDAATEIVATAAPAAPTALRALAPDAAGSPAIEPPAGVGAPGEQDAISRIASTNQEAASA